MTLLSFLHWDYFHLFKAPFLFFSTAYIIIWPSETQTWDLKRMTRSQQTKRRETTLKDKLKLKSCLFACERIFTSSHKCKRKLQLAVCNSLLTVILLLFIAIQKRLCLYHKLLWSRFVFTENMRNMLMVIYVTTQCCVSVFQTAYSSSQEDRAACNIGSGA